MKPVHTFSDHALDVERALNASDSLATNPDVLPLGERGHGRVLKFIGVDDDSESISFQRRVAKDIRLMKGKRAHRIWSLQNLQAALRLA